MESMSLHTSFSADEEGIVRARREAGKEGTRDMTSWTKEEAVDKQITEVRGQETEEEGDCVYVVFLPSLDALRPLILNPFQIHSDGVYEIRKTTPTIGDA